MLKEKRGETAPLYMEHIDLKSLNCSQETKRQISKQCFKDVLPRLNISITGVCRDTLAFYKCTESNTACQVNSV